MKKFTSTSHTTVFQTNVKEKFHCVSSIFEDDVADVGVDKYLSFALWSFAITDGKEAENPGMWPNIQINSFSIRYKSWLLHKEIINNVWIWVLMMAFPIKVAKKNSQKGMPNCPHIIPARSNSGFGTEARIKIVMKLRCWEWERSQRFVRLRVDAIGPCSSEAAASSSFTASGSLPDKRAARDIK